MEKPQELLQNPLASSRDRILNSYWKTIESSFRQNRSQLKLINYGTGSGKTHQLFEALYQQKSLNCRLFSILQLAIGSTWSVF